MPPAIPAGAAPAPPNEYRQGLEALWSKLKGSGGAQEPDMRIQPVPPAPMPSDVKPSMPKVKPVAKPYTGPKMKGERAEMRRYNPGSEEVSASLSRLSVPSEEGEKLAMENVRKFLKRPGAK